MDNIQLFAEIQGGTGGYGSYREIDLYDDEPIKFSKSIQEIENPQATTSAFTRTFRIPANSSNGKYFKAVFNVNSTDFDATQKANAYINVNGAYFTGGNIRLSAIYTNQRRSKIEYEIVFMGETSSFAAEVSPRNMSEINLNDLGHNFTYTNVKLSWNAGPGSTGGLLNGDVVYPLCEWGYTYGDDKLPEQSTLSVYTGTTAGSMKGFTNVNHPLSITQFKPAVRAKKIWDSIFDDAGYTYESNFLDSMFFSNLYMISTDQSTSNSTLISTAYANVGLNYSGPSTYPLSSWTKITGMSEYSDNTNSFDPTNNRFTVPFTGYYQIQSEVTVTYTPSGASPGGAGTYKSFNYVLYKNGVSHVVRTGFVPSNNNTGTYTQQAASMIYPLATGIFDFSDNFVQGDVLELYIFPNSYYFNYLIINQGFVTFEGPSVVMPSGLMPSQYKQIDFIKGINDRFKLMWEPDPQNPKNFYIEPWVDWVKNGQQKDWTDKLDEAKDISIKPLFYTQPRKVVFKDSEESDLYNFSYQQNNKETFGQLNQDSNIELITGEREIKSFFAPMPLAPIGGTGTFLVPHFAKDTETERQPIQVKPRLVFYNGEQTAPIAYYMLDDNNTSSQQQTYPLISQFNYYPFDATCYDLNWTNSPQFWDPAYNTYGGTGFDGRTPQTTYTKYWEAWFNSTYNPYSRIMEAYFVLNSTDIQDLSFNDIIFVKDSWWLPTKISDYVLGSKQSVKVEMIKLGGNVGISIGVTGPTSVTGPILHQFTGLCFGLSQCDAWCCRSPKRYTIYTYEKFLNQSNTFFSNPSGSITAQAGWYSDGVNTYQVNQFGVVIAVGTGSGCSCGSTLNAFSVCASQSFCGACCCTSYTTTVYGDGASLADSTVLWADSGGTVPLTPNYYYKNASAQVQLGSNGSTITQYGICTYCNCGGFDNGGTYSFSLSTDAKSATPEEACFNTSPEKFESFFQDAALFVDSIEFYYDVNAQNPIGPGGATGYVSDGYQVKYFEGATASANTLCSSYTPVDRTSLVTINTQSLIPTDFQADLIFYTCPAPEIYSTLQIESYSGTLWNQTESIYYNPTNFFAVEISVLSPCTVSYQYIQSGIIIDSRAERIEPGVSRIFQNPTPIEDFPTEVRIQFSE